MGLFGWHSGTAKEPRFVETELTRAILMLTSPHFRRRPSFLRDSASRLSFVVYIIFILCLPRRRILATSRSRRIKRGFHRSTVRSHELETNSATLFSSRSTSLFVLFDYF